MEQQKRVLILISLVAAFLSSTSVTSMTKGQTPGSCLGRSVTIAGTDKDETIRGTV